MVFSGNNSFHIIPLETYKEGYIGLLKKGFTIFRITHKLTIKTQKKTTTQWWLEPQPTKKYFQRKKLWGLKTITDYVMHKYSKAYYYYNILYHLSVVLLCSYFPRPILPSWLLLITARFNLMLRLIFITYHTVPYIASWFMHAFYLWLSDKYKA